MAAACGGRARLLPVPMPVAYAAAMLSEWWGRCRSGVGYFNRDKVREIRACGWVADGQRAKAILQFVPSIGLRQGLAAVAGSGPGRPGAA